jgi:hypothetical protein
MQLKQEAIDQTVGKEPKTENVKERIDKSMRQVNIVKAFDEI